MSHLSSVYKDSKQHLLVLDGLRGVAAVMVIFMHCFEIFCAGDYHKMIINHGYLAVDFFFMLSGYVMAHAYDNRWNQMTILDFMKRRLIRLHPLIIIGTLLGAVLFYFQASPVFPKVSGTSLGSLLLIMLIGFTIIPIPPSMDIRGWNEMHPLNGPTWSLFFEYIANLLHVFVLRKLSVIALSILVFLSGVALVDLAVMGKSGDLIGGWSLEPLQLRFGFTRLLFPYMAGMLLRRITGININKNTFLLCSLLLILVLSVPRIGGRENLWMNGLYESVTILFIFPLIIFLGARGNVQEGINKQVCIFLGNISYPLYITHFPLICVFYAWVSNEKIPLSKGLPVVFLLVTFSVVMAYIWLKLYDEPVRKWLAQKWMMKTSNIEGRD